MAFRSRRPGLPRHQRSAINKPMLSDMSPESVAVFPTKLGWIAFSMCGNLLQRLSFGHANPQSAATTVGQTLWQNRNGNECQDDSAANLIDRLIAYAGGHFDDFLDVQTDTAHLSPFSRSIIEAVRRIPFGQTRSYGQLAASVGRARAARAVGRVMAQNRTPLVVPCHRVVGSGGSIGGFSAIDGLNMKRRLLKLEAAGVVAAR
jgi:methylated-DNA-[protein]-cysteine S-methyltransferase